MRYAERNKMTNPRLFMVGGVFCAKARLLKLTDLDVDGIFSAPKAYEDTSSGQKNDLYAKYGDF